MNKIINYNMKSLGNLPVSEGLKHLKQISVHFGLRLYVASEYKMALRLFNVIHSNDELFY